MQASPRPSCVLLPGTLVPQELLQRADIEDALTGRDPYLTTDYYPVLAEIPKSKRPRTILEIGVRYGYSLAVVLDACPSVVRAYGIDLNESPGWGGVAGALGVARQNLECLRQEGRWPKLKRLVLMEMNTQAALELPGLANVDFAYLDGDHSPSGCLHDFELVLSAMAPGGLMVGDDADHGGLRGPIEEWAASRGFPAEYVSDRSSRGRVLVSLPLE